MHEQLTVPMYEPDFGLPGHVGVVCESARVGKLCAKFTRSKSWTTAR